MAAVVIRTQIKNSGRLLINFFIVIIWLSLVFYQGVKIQFFGGNIDGEIRKIASMGMRYFNENPRLCTQAGTPGDHPGCT